MALPTNDLAGYRLRVRQWLHETDSNKSFWSDTFIDQQLNSSYALRSAELVMAFEGYFELTAQRDIVADQSRYAFPSGFEKLLKMEVISSDGKTSTPVQRQGRHFASNALSGGSGCFTYRLTGGGFILEPTPTTSVTNGLQLEYVGTPPSLESDTDTFHPDFPGRFLELIILDATVACIDSETILENGLIRSVVRLRAEWEERFEEYIHTRSIHANYIEPFIPFGNDC